MFEDSIFQNSEGGITKRGLQYQQGWEAASTRLDVLTGGCWWLYPCLWCLGPKKLWAVPECPQGTQPREKGEETLC